MTDIESVLETLRETVTTLLDSYQFWLGYELIEQDVDQKEKEEDLEALRTNLLDPILSICEAYNDTAAYLGRKLPNSFDEKFLSFFGPLKRRSKRVEQGLEELQESILTKESLDEDKVEKYFHNIEVVGKTIEAILKCIATYSDEAKLIEQQRQTLPPIEPLRPFCRAAWLYQFQNTNDIHRSAELETATSGRQSWGYQCHVCGLEVGDYPALRISNDGKCFVSSNLLAASHLEKFASLKNQRAFYRCLVCWKWRKIMDFPNAVAYEQHMEQHMRSNLPKTK